MTRFVYDLAGEPVAPALPDSSTRTGTYWPDCVSKTQIDGKNNTTSSAEDALGRVASVTGELTKNGATTQGYDAASQLTTAVVGSTSTAYTFDARGDRTKATTGSVVATYGYDQVNRLTSYTRGTTTASYTYNGDGLRASKKVGSTTTKFVYDTAEGLPLVLTDGAYYYLYGPGGVPFEQVTTAGTVTYLHADQLGSIRMITSSTGTSVGTATYTAYGTRTATGTTSAFGYAGQYTDTESGLQWLRARYYDPTTGQFLTVDPLAAATGARYAYAAGNPITGTDPSGLDWYNPLTWTGDTYDVIAGVASATALVLQLPSLVVAATGLGLPAAGVLEEVATGAELVAGLASIGGVAQHLREGDNGRAALSAVGAIPLLGLGSKGIYSLVRFSAEADAGGSIARGVGSGWRWAATRASAVGALAEGARAWWEVGQNLYCNRDLLW